MVQVGLRGEYAIHDRFAVVGSIRTHRTGQTVTSGEEYTGAQSFVAAYSANTAGVGLKADVETFKGILQGYVATQALLHHATMRLDDDGNSRTNAGQVQSSSISAGFEATAGIELKVSPKTPVSFGWFNEVGVGLIANHSYRGAKDVNGTEVLCVRCLSRRHDARRVGISQRTWRTLLARMARRGGGIWLVFLFGGCPNGFSPDLIR